MKRVGFAITGPGFGRGIAGCLAPPGSGLLFLVLILSLACGSKSTTSRAYLPETGQVEGWNKSGATRAFPPDRLFEYIDGDADRFLKAGVGQTLTSDYRYGDKIDAVADVFVMKDPAGATQVFESQPASGSQPVEIGDAARLYPGTLMFRRGRFFVRLVAYEESPEIQQALPALARSIAARLE